MKSYYKIIFILLVTSLLSQCSDPLDVDATREQVVKFDPNNLPAVFDVVPNIINLGIILPEDSMIYPFYIKNITSKDVSISSVTLKNKPEYAIFTLPQSPIVLKPKDTDGDKMNLSINFHALSPGYFVDTIEFEGFKNPKTIVKVELPAVFARDIDFHDKKINTPNLGIMKIYNNSNVKVIITDFQFEQELVFTNNPKFQTPYTINAHSVSDDIKITFIPNEDTSFVKTIKFKAEFENPAANTEFPIDSVVILKGRGIK